MQNLYNNPHQNYQMQQLLLQQQAQARAGQNQMQNPAMMQGNMMQNPAVVQMMMQMMQNPAMMQQMVNAVPPQQMQQQQPQPHSNPMQQNGRYGGGPIPQQQPQPQQQFTPEPTADARFSSKVAEEEEQAETVLNVIKTLVVTAKHGSYPLTKKLSIAPKATAFTEKSLHSSDKLNVCYSISEAVTAINEEFKDLEEVKTFITSDTVIIDDGYSVTSELPVFNSLFQDDIKGLYKRLRSAYAETSNIETAVMLNRIDEYFTKLTNDYLKTCLREYIAIDRFSLDFNDLLKILRDHFEDEEDDLWEYLTKEIKEINSIINNADYIENKNEFRFMTGVTIVCFKEHHFKAGLAEVKDGVFNIDNQEAGNLFLLTLSEHIFNLADRTSFYLSTSDRELFEFTKNNKGSVFVERK